MSRRQVACLFPAETQASKGCWEEGLQHCTRHLGGGRGEELGEDVNVLGLVPDSSQVSKLGPSA